MHRSLKYSALTIDVYIYTLYSLGGSATFLTSGVVSWVANGFIIMLSKPPNGPIYEHS